MTLSKVEKREVMQNLDIEIGSMFDRLASNYGRPGQKDQALFLPKLEAYIKQHLLEYPLPARSGARTP